VWQESFSVVLHTDSAAYPPWFQVLIVFWLMMSRATIHDHRRSDGLLRRHPATQQFPCYRLLD